MERSNLTNEFLRIEEDCTVASKAHFNACDRLGSINLILGVLAISGAGVAGAASSFNFVTLIVIASFVTGISSALLTFLNPSECATRHKSAGNLLLTVKNDARLIRMSVGQSSENDLKLESGLRELSSKKNTINSMSPQYSSDDLSKAKMGIRKGEANYEVDQ
ncbi:MAG: SLATT domain-containing protein [Rhodobacteraceae bacterium]|nr:SLATT domain-containing protein [Paracoccaceae bacterium]